MMQSGALPGVLPQGCMQTSETETHEFRDTTPIDPARWVDDHGDFLFRYAVVRLRDDSLAEDAVQETLLSAIQSMGSYAGKSAERTWLAGILKHKIIDHFRKTSRLVPLDPADMDLAEFDPLFERQDEFKDHWHDALSPRIWNMSPEAALQQDEFFGVLQNCLSKLPERVATCFSLREMDGIESDEICKILNLTASNFWVMMHRARMSLRRCIEINWFIKGKMN
jgi:RNA polymerase sigma-70 factor, ECF subfamily